MQMSDQKDGAFDAATHTEGAKGPPTPETDGETEAESGRGVIERLRSGVAAARDPLVGRVGNAVTDVGNAWHERPGARVRRVRRMGTQPLTYLYDVHPEARYARPVDVGLRTLDVDEIAGTAVGGGAQRGGDFLPLKASRTNNWQARWQRLRRAHDSLTLLPPIDVFKYGGRYWVVDGHNRVALALYGGQVAIDANVIELVPLGKRRTEPIGSLAPSVAASRAVRTAGKGERPSLELTREDATSTAPPDDGGDG
jgi:hypothetical protein